MQNYFFVLLKTGPNNSNDAAKINSAIAGHMANMKVMINAGKLKLAGPFKGDPELRGIFIIDAASEKELTELLSKDTAINEGFLLAEIKKWCGPSGIKFDPD